jgi:dTDP-4-dehydrorhamnose 3,5-epimerase
VYHERLIRSSDVAVIVNVKYITYDFIMKFIPTEIPEVVLIIPDVYEDDRGYFFETYRDDLIEAHIGRINFIQDNESKSKYGVIRGLHYQLPPYAQSKLVRVISGEVLDVALDIRKDSKSYGKYVIKQLSEENRHQLYIPKGFAHGFAVLSKEAVACYKVDAPYASEYEGGIRYNDPQVDISWGINIEDVSVSEKDMTAPFLLDARVFGGVSK